MAEEHILVWASIQVMQNPWTEEFRTWESNLDAAENCRLANLTNEYI